jgi:succinate-semialdehyde dehydrogenase/glutarate-semialdehyde dehydrogenase
MPDSTMDTSRAVSADPSGTPSAAPDSAAPFSAPRSAAPRSAASGPAAPRSAASGPAAPGPAALTDPPAVQLDPGLIRRLIARVAASSGAETVVTTTPLTGLPLAEIPRCTAQDVAVAVANARHAQAAWAATPIRGRAAVLRRVHDLILERRSEILDVVQTETGKSRGHAYDEVADAAINARFYARRGPHLLRDVRRGGIMPVLTQIREVRHPKGVIGIVSPWNYPLSLSLSDSLPALLAGNAVVIKPDSQTTLTALWAAELLAEAGLPEGLFQVVAGAGSVVGTALFDLADYLCFTGSTATGRRVALQAAGRLVGASLELGGKNGCYVAADADLDRAAEGLIRDCFSSAGQLCVSIERLYLHESVADAFLASFVPRVEGLRLGAALDFSADVGSLASAQQFATVSAHVQDAVAQGATVLAGGKPRPDLGPYFFEPTLLADVPPTATCHREETFGPVVSVYRVHDDDEAVRLINDSVYGLNGAIWTKDLRRGARLARRITAGTTSVNESFTATWGSVAAPMGGRGQSGIGRRHGTEGLYRFTEVQTVAVQRLAGLGLLYGLGPQRFADTFTRLLRLSKATRFPWP